MVTADATGQHIAAPTFFPRNIATTIAIGHLIAASPDLLEAAHLFVQAMRSPTGPLPDLLQLVEALHATDKALAKAVQS